MKKLKPVSLFLALIFSVQATALAQTANPADKIKKYVNKMVQKVEAADEPEEKRAIMDKTFTDMIAVFEQVDVLAKLTQSDRSAINRLKTDITAKQDELNGLNGYARVENNSLNDFATFVQQDLEQADEYVTISVSLLVLIGILLLVL